MSVRRLGDFLLHAYLQRGRYGQAVMGRMVNDFSDFHKSAERLVQSSSIQELWDVHLKNMATFGFDRMLYVSTRVSGPNDWGAESDRLVLTNYPQEVIDVFLGQQLYRKVAKVVRPGNGAGAYSWGRRNWESEEGRLSQAEEQHRQLCRKWQLDAGYTVWFSEEGWRRKSVLGLCAKVGCTQVEVDTLWQEQGSQIHALCNIMHIKAATLPPPGHRTLLTERQRQVLDHVAEGDSVQEAARKLGLSHATVEKHLRLARKALNAETTANAVRKAAGTNQLFLLPPDRR